MDVARIVEHAVALAMAGRFEEALPGFRACVVLAPADAQSIVNLANGLIATRRHSAGAVWFRRGLALGAVDATTLMGLGIALNARHEYDQAARAFHLALDRDPASPTIMLGYGHSLVSLGRSREALVSLRRVVALEPAHRDALKTLGSALLALDDAGSGIGILRRSLAMGMGDADAISRLAMSYRAVQQTAASVAWAQRGLAWHPGDPSLLEAYGNAILYAGDIVPAGLVLSRALAIEPAAAKSHSNLLFALSYDDTLSNERFYDAFRRWERRHAEPIYASARSDGPSRANGKRIRIGYASGEFRDHPIAQLMEGIFVHHDRSRFEVAGYAEVDNPDHVTRRLQSVADLWRSTVGVSDEKAADLIHEDGIDILVMLGAHTGRNRPLILAHRPAPIQATMHDLSTSGMRVVDAWLTDPVLHPPDNSEGHTETLVRLPSLYLHREPEHSPDVSELPCLRAGGITFGSFSIPPKLNDRVLRLWSRVLAAVPGSRLVIGHNAAYADPLIASRFRRRCEVAGIAADRLHLVTAYAGRQDHLARVGSLDIALDPFPFNGGITTFEALWMGVPVVTLEGKRFAARGCASHLAQVGLDHLIASDEQSYVEIAVGLAQSPEALGELRASLRQRVRSSRLCDAPAYVRALEEALFGLWARRG
ncbi:MAG: hypothetical protein FJX54_16525 [Alphaproteobacteria bacterium]|nr:hypothetical protein [Alphaproteobacteria bacterium]